MEIINHCEFPKLHPHTSKSTEDVTHFSESIQNGEKTHPNYWTER